MSNNGPEQQRGIMGRLFGREREVVDPREWEAASIRGIHRADLLPIIQWGSLPEVRGHLDPPPPMPQDWNDAKEVEDAIAKLNEYYMNVGSDGIAEPEKIIPVVTENVLGRTIAVNTIRLKGDKYVMGKSNRDRKIASAERMIVNPKVWGKDVGTLSLAATASIALDRVTAYAGKPADELRMWIMTDVQAGEYARNFNLALRLGFVPVQGENVIYKEFLEERGIKTDRRAIWMSLKPEPWGEFKRNYPQVMTKVDQVLDLASLRLRGRTPNPSEANPSGFGVLE